MSKFKKMLYAACALLVASIVTTPLSAGSLSDINWSDPFGASGGGAAGLRGGRHRGDRAAERRRV